LGNFLKVQYYGGFAEIVLEVLILQLGYFLTSVGNPDSGKEFIPNSDLIPEKLAHLRYTPLLFQQYNLNMKT
jgi:hypothetical protein